MVTTLALDPSRPCQLAGDLLVVWLPRGRGRDALASGLVAVIAICANPRCACTDATLHTRLIDDRATRVTRDGDALKIESRASPHPAPQPCDDVILKLDITTGLVRTVDGGKPPELVAPFFAEALPFWVLDALWEAWLAPRRPSEIDWRSIALAQWDPDQMLATSIAYPDDRPDRYVVDGTLYQLDTMFCVRPDCDCTTCVLVLLAVTFDGPTTVLTQVASASLPLASMVLEAFEGEHRFHRPLISAYLDWRQRQVPPEARLLELRELTRQRGRELHQILSQRLPSVVSAAPRAAMKPAPRALVLAPRPTAATRAAPEPGRNATCPCGSGKKYKRCCGK